MEAMCQHCSQTSPFSRAADQQSVGMLPAPLETFALPPRSWPIKPSMEPSSSGSAMSELQCPHIHQSHSLVPRERRGRVFDDFDQLELRLMPVPAPFAGVGVAGRGPAEARRPLHGHFMAHTLGTAP